MELRLPADIARMLYDISNSPVTYEPLHGSLLVEQHDAEERTLFVVTDTHRLAVYRPSAPMAEIPAGAYRILGKCGPVKRVAAGTGRGWARTPDDPLAGMEVRTLALSPSDYGYPDWRRVAVVPVGGVTASFGAIGYEAGAGRRVTLPPGMSVNYDYIPNLPDWSLTGVAKSPLHALHLFGARVHLGARVRESLYYTIMPMRGPDLSCAHQEVERRGDLLGITVPQLPKIP